jgi:hypothetical protein
VDHITLTRADGSTFSLQARPPRSFAARFDLAAALGQRDAAQPAERLRITAAGLGMALTGQHPEGDPGARMPAYRNDGDLMAYGGQVVETVAGKWGVVPTEEFWQVCVLLCWELVGSLPSAEGVKEREDFTSAREDASTSTSP